MAARRRAARRRCARPTASVFSVRGTLRAFAARASTARTRSGTTADGAVRARHVLDAHRDPEVVRLSGRRARSAVVAGWSREGARPVRAKTGLAVNLRDCDVARRASPTASSTAGVSVRRGARRRPDRLLASTSSARRAALAVPLALNNEEWLVVVAATPTLRTPEGERALRDGDVVGFAEGEAGAHTFCNRTSDARPRRDLLDAAGPATRGYPRQRQARCTARRRTRRYFRVGRRRLLGRRSVASAGPPRCEGLHLGRGDCGRRSRVYARCVSASGTRSRR